MILINMTDAAPGRLQADMNQVLRAFPLMPQLKNDRQKLLAKPLIKATNSMQDATP